MNDQHHNSEKKDSAPATPASAPHQKNATMAAIAYIIFFVPLLTDAKNDPFVKYHVKQGLVLLIAVVLLHVIVSMLWIFQLMMLVNLAWLILVILGILNATSGKQEPLPLIGQFGTKFNF